MRQRGFHLTELVIALGLGLLLVAAFLTALQRCRTLFATHESLARLQDAGRHALSVLVPDLEHAGFYGFTPPRATRLLRGDVPVADSAQLLQPLPGASPTPAAGLPAGAHACGVNFAVDLTRAVQGSNNSYALDCVPTASAGGARAGSDTLTLRHASLAVAAPHSGRIQLYSRRLESQTTVDLFADGRPPGPSSLDREIRDLEVRTYYVANNSVDRPGWPALRVKALTESRGAAQFRDEEILPGVEDLQVEFGIAGSGGAVHVRFVPADFAGLESSAVVAVRFWLRLRSDSTESGFRDDRPLDYADVHFAPTPLEATQRRLLIERTVALRNLP